MEKFPAQNMQECPEWRIAMRTIKEGDTVIVETIVPFGPHHMKKTLARVVHTPANSGDLLYFETMLSHAPFAVNPQASAFTGMSLMPFNEVPPDLPLSLIHI